MKSFCLFVGFFLITLPLTACTNTNPEEEKLAQFAMETICLAKEGADKIASFANDPEIQGKIAEESRRMEDRLIDLLQKYGYESNTDAEEAFLKIGEKEKWSKQVEKMAIEKCAADTTLVEKFLADLKIHTE